MVEGWRRGRVLTEKSERGEKGEVLDVPGVVSRVTHDATCDHHISALVADEGKRQKVKFQSD